MATVFDAAEVKRQKRQAEVEAELADMRDAAPPYSAEEAAVSEEKPRQGRRDPRSYSRVLRDAAPSNGWWSAFVPQPEARFESQHDDEQILLVLRQHPIVNLRWIGLAALMFLAPYLFFPFIPVLSYLPDHYSFFFMVGWYLFIFTTIIEGFLGWYFNIYIITDERIIDIDFVSMIYKKVSEAKIDKIEDVTSTTAGVLGAVLNFGDITVQTAAEKREFEFSKVPEPTKVTQFLNELILEEEAEKNEGRTH